MFKNVASQKWKVFAFDLTDNTPVTGDAANISAKIGIDYAAASATNDTNPTEIEDGYYYFDLTQAETNGDVLDLFPESSTADVQVIGVPGTIYTNPPNFTDLSVTSSTGRVAVGTNNDKTGYSISGTKTTLDNLNDLSAAQVNSEVDTALGDYDAPTRTELTSDVNSILTVLGTPVGADLSTDIANVDTNVDAILVDTGTTLPSTLSTLATSSALAMVDTNVDAILLDTGTTLPSTLSMIASYIDTEISAIQAVTDNLPDGGALTTIAKADALASVGSNVAAILVDTGTTLPATLSTLATAANLATVDSNVDAILVDTGTTLPVTLSTLATASALSTVDTNVSAILVDTGTTLPATLSGLATSSDLATVDSNVDAILVDTGTTLPSTLSTLSTSISGLENISASVVKTQVDTALSDIHLDHLLAVDYDPASKPGVSTALFNELIVSDSGVSQFSANALENAPSGGGGGSVTVDDISSAALAKFLTVDTGETSAVDGSVGKISQGSAGGNVTVESFTGDASTSITAIQAKTDIISSAIITVTSPVLRSGAVQIVRGDDYSNSDSRGIDFTNEDGDWPDLTSATVVFTAKNAKTDNTDFTGSMSVVTATGVNQKVRLELTDTQTSGLKTGKFSYDVQATLSSGNIVTLQRMVQGFEVLEDYT